MQKTDSISPIEWRDNALYLLDQRLLPGASEFLRIDSAMTCADAIRVMVVRGAPAIGIAAAYGVVIAARARYKSNPENWHAAIIEDLDLMGAARPTAVNLSWALDRMKRVIGRIRGDPVPDLLQEAKSIHDEDIAGNHAMARIGADFIKADSAVITHCNAGALATGGYGTALGVIREAWKMGKLTEVFVDETRPWLQGSRLTAWELTHDGVPVSLIADSAAAKFLRDGAIHWAIVGADRIAANGDVANKIGTYSLAVTARHHNVKVMVAAPLSTIDLDCQTGDDIPIENRNASEIWQTTGVDEPPPLVSVKNPAFDITPADLVDVIVTERGAVAPPTVAGIRALFEAE